MCEYTLIESSINADAFTCVGLHLAVVFVLSTLRSASSTGKIHLLSLLLCAAVVAQLLAVMDELVHWWSFSHNGVGIPWLDFFAAMLQVTWNQNLRFTVLHPVSFASNLFDKHGLCECGDVG